MCKDFLTGNKMSKKIKIGFTLAESMIVILIIGIIATLTIPPTLKHKSETTTITKVKGAMKLYTDIVTRVVAYNDLYTDEKLKQWAGDDSNNCANSNKYFKYTEGSGCTFKTEDGIWWNISDFSQPLISINKIDTAESLQEAMVNATKENDKTSFYFSARFDDEGQLRVNDNAFEHENPKGRLYKYIAKLYDFIYSTKTTNQLADVCNNPICKVVDIYIDTLLRDTNIIEYERGDYETDCSTWADEDKRNCTSCKKSVCYVYNEDNKLAVEVTTSGNQSCLTGAAVCNITYFVNTNAKTVSGNHKNVALETHYKRDGSFDYYFARIFNDEGFKEQSRYGCNEQNICTKVEFYNSYQNGNTVTEQKLCTIQYNRNGTEKSKTNHVANGCNGKSYSPG